jgi:hypothetical protein
MMEYNENNPTKWIKLLEIVLVLEVAGFLMFMSYVIVHLKF